MLDHYPFVYRQSDSSKQEASTFSGDGVRAETQSSPLEKRLHVATVGLRLGGRAAALVHQRAHQSQLREQLEPHAVLCLADELEARVENLANAQLLDEQLSGI